MYKVKIEKGAVERKDNSEDNSEISWSFTTMKEPVATPEQVFTDLPPTQLGLRNNKQPIRGKNSRGLP